MAAEAVPAGKRVITAAAVIAADMTGLRIWGLVFIYGAGVVESSQSCLDMCAGTRAPIRRNTAGMAYIG
ncbi:hypothetical protein [Streptomyces sp. NBC_01022]|uniref:hypothetical protein n=1 Tax=Streptomyces sp. NBC_01022 TaxID=2903723 RepID=UPI002DDC3A64|nr:hypothetical protein [Streptomyces sp. NBC_01022]WRZ79527.1 hypothetical protein OG316_04225 [Streptomyces sp. NBC_01022]